MKSQKNHFHFENNAIVHSGLAFLYTWDNYVLHLWKEEKWLQLENTRN